MADHPRVLVTGANGFLGAHIVSQSRALGWDVTAAHRHAEGNGAVAIDVCNADSVEAAFQAVLPSMVIHCAAYGVNYAEQDFDRAVAVNVWGSLRVLTTAARFGLRRFVHVGSAVEYGSQAGLISEEAPLKPTAIYGATKAAATLLLQQRARSLDVPLLIARPFGIWGPGEGMHHLIPQVVTACIDRTPLKLTSCEVIRDYMYVEDVVDRVLSLALAEESISEGIVNIGSGAGVVLRDFVLSIAKLLDGAHLMQFGALPYRPTEMPSLVADIGRMRRLLGSCTATPLGIGVQEVVNSLVSSGAAHGTRFLVRPFSGYPHEVRKISP